MEKLTKEDYIIFSSDIEEWMLKNLIGLVMYNEKMKRLEVITEIKTVQKKENVGSWIKPIWKTRKVLHAIEVKIVEKGEFKTQTLIPQFPKKFIENVIPERSETYKKIISDYKSLL